MNKAETAAGLIVTAVGALLLVEANKLAYMVENVPGPGFLPLWVAFAIVAAGVVLTIKAIRPALVPSEPTEWPDAQGWRQMVIMLGALAIALLLLEPLGFLVTAALFMLAMIFSLGMRSWRTMLFVPILSALVLHLVFAVWLEVPLPRGILSLFE